ncbi:MAG: class II aldolase/adducin family protein [Verrucomicrobiota bacterium]
MSDVAVITELSHEFGAEEFVLGGGGNTSCKDKRTLWIKPSGTTLADISPDDFVAMDRKKLRKVTRMKPPADAAEREAKVKDLMMKAVRPESAGKRPSVESPLHEAFESVYVVHTHPALVNGLTCAEHGGEACARLFPNALWMSYEDPGYKLSVQVRDALEKQRREHGKEPAMLLVANHGVFVGGDDAEEVRATYGTLMDTLQDEYAARDIETELPVQDMPPVEQAIEMQNRLRRILGEEEAAFVVASGRFKPVEGPLTPDHMVYSRAFPFVGEPSPEALEEFRVRHGYAPKVVVTPNAAYGVGTSEKNARLALALAKDAALVQQLASAFGGMRLMSDEARLFIENWEVESYRQNVAETNKTA